MIKQTQTKMFDFSDADLDFCSGSKNKFPEVFKKMLANGYNSKIVSSVTINGDQVTLDYGVNHGYAADRVLAINTPGLVGEFYIDSVTSNTLTITVPNAPAAVAGGFTTKVAPLGWELVYELAHVHIYKFKHIDDTDMYARFCFQNTTSAGRNCIAVGLGRTVNFATGVITDENCLDDLKACATVAESTSNIRWDFTSGTARTWDSYTYSQGFSFFGRGLIVGSLYHLVLFYSMSTSISQHLLSAILPFKSDYQNLNYPILIAQNNQASTASISGDQLSRSRILCGKTLCSGDRGSTVFYPSFANSSFLPESIDQFNTTTCFPIQIFTATELQYLGHVQGGLYQAIYDRTNIPSTGNALTPSVTMDVDFLNLCPLHPIGGASGQAWFTAPVEAIKNA